MVMVTHCRKCPLIHLITVIHGETIMFNTLDRIWSPVLLLFQFFGYASYVRRPTSNNLQHAQRLAFAGIIAILVVAFGIYTISSQISFHGQLQLNEMTDNSVLLTVFTAHTIGLLEALVIYQKGSKHFEQIYDILTRTSYAESVDDNLRRFRIQFLLKNCLQLSAVVVVFCVGIGVTGWQTWLYFRWIIFSEIAVGVRLIELSMHVEIIAKLMGNLESMILCEIAGADVERDQIGSKLRCARLQSVCCIYDDIYRLSETISTMYEWSVFAILVYAINGMINTTFWILYCIFKSVIM